MKEWKRVILFAKVKILQKIELEEEIDLKEGCICSFLHVEEVAFLAHIYFLR